MYRRLVVAILSSLIAMPAFPCSTLFLVRNGEAVFGRNYDFEFGDGLVLVNRRGLLKHSYAGTASWTSRYGSVTFNQFGREFPMDGMNEAGLVVALMWLDETVYPQTDERPSFGVLEWIQYQLDNYGSVAEVLAHAEEIRIRKGGTPLHYLIGDATGAAATIEYLQGNLVVHTGSSLPTANLTNDSYERSLAYFRAQRSMPGGPGSLQRFTRAAMMMQRVSATKPLRDEAMSILDNVAQPGWTRWSVAYDATHHEIMWKTLTSGSEKTLRMSDLSFACSSPAMMIDVSVNASGNVAPRLQPYTAGANLQLLIHSYASTSFLRDTPMSDIEADAAHAESSRCAPTQRRRSAR